MLIKRLFSPSYLKSLCVQYNLTPSKRYGQNYLINTKPISKIIEVANLKKDDVVVEIGPGFGVLTFALLNKVKRVYAFEIEKRLESYWNDMVNGDFLMGMVNDGKKGDNTSLPPSRGERQVTTTFNYLATTSNNIKLIWGNVLKFEIKNLGIKNYKVVANLPYQITSAVIRKFLESDNPPIEMILMVQKEVAQRICAKPGKMSLLSVAVQYYAKPEIIAQIPRSYFWPEPKVDSAIVKLKIYQINKAKSSDWFFKIVKFGFASKRKMLINNLMAFLGKDKKTEILEIFKKIGLTKKARAELLSIKDWEKLVYLLK